MLRWTAILVMLLIASWAVGYVGLVQQAVRVAHVLFWLSAGVFLLSVVFGRR